MFFYLSLFFIVLVLAFSFDNKATDGFIIAILLFFSMFRGNNVGIDTISYIQNLSTQDTSFFTDTSSRYYEITFYFAAYIIEYFHLGNQTIIYFFSVITFLFLVLACKRFKVSISLVLAFYILFNFYCLSFNISRQFAAVSIMLFAYSFLQYDDKRKYFFFIFVLFASTIHFSSLFYIVVYFLKDIKFSKKNILFIILTLNIISMFFIKESINALIKIIAPVIQYQQYFDQIDSATRSVQGIIIYCMILTFNIIVYYDIQKDESKRRLSNLLLISIIISTIIYGIYGNIGRVKYSIEIINVIFYALYFKNINSYKKLVMIILVCIVFGYVVYYSLNGNFYKVIPYYLSF